MQAQAIIGREPLWWFGRRLKSKKPRRMYGEIKKMACEKPARCQREDECERKKDTIAHANARLCREVRWRGMGDTKKTGVEKKNKGQSTEYGGMNY